LVSRSIWNAYALAIVVTAGTLFMRVALASWIGDHPLMVIFVIPILFSAYAGGIGPGSLSTFMVALGTAYFVFAPLQSLSLARSADVTQWTILIATGVLISVLNETLHRSRRIVERKNESLKAEVEVRRQAEDELQKLSLRTEQRARMLTTTLSSINDFACVLDQQARFLFANQALLNLWGITPEAAFGKSFIELGYPDELAEKLLRQAQAVFASKKCLTDETPYTNPAGLKGHYEYIFSPAFAADGTVDFVVGCTRDITARKVAEDALRHSEERLRLITDLVPHGIFAKDAAGRHIFANPALAELAGLSIEELLGRNDFELVTDKAQAEAYRADDLAVIRSGRKLVVSEEPRTDLSGRTRFLQTIKVPFTVPETGEPAVLGVCMDITEQRQTQRLLQESEERYRALVERSSESISVQRDGKIIYVNPAAIKMMGASSAQDLVGKLSLDLVHPDFRRIVLERLKNSADRGEFLPRMEEKLIKLDGTVIDVEAEGMPIIYEGEPALYGSMRDITERKLAEQMLQSRMVWLNLLHHITRATGERHDLQSILQVVIRSLEDDLPVDFGCVCVHDAPAKALKVVHVGVKSTALAKQLALSEKELVRIDENGLSRCLRGQLVYEPDTVSMQFPFPQRLARGGLRSLVIAPLVVESKVFGVLIAARREPQGFVSGECEFLRQLCEHVALAWQQSDLYSALQKAYDDLRQTQEAVMQQERLRSLGQMASGIAHDINNAISPVSLYAESLLETEPNLSARGRDYLETIARAIDDVAQTVARMSEFYRKREPQLTLASVNLNQLVKQVVDLTRARWSDIPQQQGIVIRMITDLPADLPGIMGVESEIREALINLVFNAVDAMPEGGDLTLRTKVLEVASALPDAPAHRQVHLETVDTGVGMDEETRQHCLEPFFTTKGERGTGLGLPMVYGMVTRHSAGIEIESVVGQGTTVRLIFAVPTTPMIDTAHQLRVPAIPSHLRILVVDDDPVTAQSLRNILEADGHLVVVTNGGQAGIDAFLDAQQRNEAFAIVITDLGMPYIDGRKVASKLKAASPATPVILLTGWGQRLVAEGDVPAGVDRVLDKPPKLRELRAALAELTT
jgi:PAS domain S-box-containing protein